MNEFQGHRELVAWQKAVQLAVDLYKVAKSLPRKELYELSSQLRRAATSIPANIAEGHARRRPAEFLRFISYALGSIAEVDTLLEIGVRSGLLNRSVVESVNLLLVEVRRLCFGLWKHYGGNAA